MSGFEDLLNNYVPPEMDDIVIQIPSRLVGRGGAGATPVVPAAAPSGAAPAGAGSTPEPEPQLPEGSDAEEPVVEDEGEAEVETTEPEPVEVVAPIPVAEAEVEATGEVADDELDEDEPEPPLREVVAFGGTKLSFEGETVHLRSFPRELVNKMREILQVQLGEPFARKITQPSIVAAFVMAAMGVDMELDADTGAAVTAFRANDPRMDLMAKNSAKLLEQQSVIETGMTKLMTMIRKVETTTSVLEIGQAYALAERTALLDTNGILPENIEVTQKRVLVARDNIRKKVVSQLTDEKTARGRPIR